MTHPLEGLTWPLARACEALETFTRLARLSHTSHAPPPGATVEDAARGFGLDAERLFIPYGELDALLTQGGPALLQVGPTEAPHLIVLVASSRTRAHILAPDSTVRRISIDAIRDTLLLSAERISGKDVDALLESISLAPKRRTRARAALLRKYVAALPFDAGWSLRLSPAAPFREQLRRSGVTRALITLTLAHAGGLLLSIASWWLVGRGALAGHLDRGWLYAWALLLATLIPLRVMTGWWQGTASIVAGVLLKRRMFLGALELDPSAVRHEGAGQLLGRVVEVGALEELAMHGGFVSLVALVELALSIPVLGLSGLAPVAAFLAWIAFAVWLVHRFAVHWLAWSRTRIAMTNDILEGMLGHRTRMVQEDPAHWHDAEDRALATYAEQAHALDRTSALIAGALPRGWLLIGLATLAPTLAANAASPEALAVGVGGVLLARNALVRVSAGMTSLVAAYASWRHAGPLFRAAVSGAAMPSTSAPTSGASDATLLDVRHVAFHYGDAARKPALRDVTLRLRGGDRVLVEGPSGSGKSTLGALMAGLLVPTGGLVLLRGLDRTSLGPQAWRRHVASAPQFHENHTISETLAFNLLMGRRWPPRREDLQEAETVCGELGLGPLLERMPGGLLQRIGETGWQLSHGERSRVYLARALLQGAELVILDESFASLDPETQKQALECATKRAPTLVVIAHP